MVFTWLLRKGFYWGRKVLVRCNQKRNHDYNNIQKSNILIIVVLEIIMRLASTTSSGIPRLRCVQHEFECLYASFSILNFPLVSSFPSTTSSLLASPPDNCEVSSLCTGLAVPLSSRISCLLVKFTVNCLLPGLERTISPSPARNAPSNNLQSL